MIINKFSGNTEILNLHTIKGKVSNLLEFPALACTGKFDAELLNALQRIHTTCHRCIRTFSVKTSWWNLPKRIPCIVGVTPATATGVP